MISAIVLVVAFLVIIYLLIGYPILLATTKPRKRQPVTKNLDYQPTVCALVAVHNGEAFIREKLNSLLAMNYPVEKFSILVVSDGSTDGTADIVKEYAAKGVRLLSIERGGKAAALSAGLAHVDSELILFTDVRQVFDPEALRHLAANFADPSVGAVTGELAYYDDSGHGEQATLDVYWRYELWAREKHSEIDSIFNTTGAIYAARRNLVQPLPADTLTDDAVLPLRIFFQGYRVIFDPEAVAWDHRTETKAEFRRKLRTLAGLWQVHFRMPELFGARNRMRLHFLSHKFGRLLLPWAILAVLVATLTMPEGRWKSFFLWNELALVALAVMAPLVPDGLRIKRLFSAARTFLSMNAAALLALGVFILPPQSFWALPTTQLRRKPPAEN